MSDNITAIASVYSSDVLSSQHNIESVSDTLQGQAQEQI